MLGEALRQARLNRLGENFSQPAASQSKQTVSSNLSFGRDTCHMTKCIPLQQTTAPAPTSIQVPQYENHETVHVLSISEQLQLARQTKNKPIVSMTTLTVESIKSSDFVSASLQHSAPTVSSSSASSTTTSNITNTCNNFPSNTSASESFNNGVNTCQANSKNWPVPEVSSISQIKRSTPLPKSFIPKVGTTPAKLNFKIVKSNPTVTSTPPQTNQKTVVELNQSQCELKSSSLIAIATSPTHIILPVKSKEDKLSSYIDMQKTGVPDEMILTKMTADGILKAAEIKAFFFFNKSISSSSSSSLPERLNDTSAIQTNVKMDATCNLFQHQDLQNIDLINAVLEGDAVDMVEGRRGSKDTIVRRSSSLQDLAPLTNIISVDALDNLSVHISVKSMSNRAIHQSLSVQGHITDNEMYQVTYGNNALLEAADSAAVDIKDLEDGLPTPRDSYHSERSRDSLISPESAVQRRRSQLSLEMITAFKENSFKQLLNVQENPLSKLTLPKSPPTTTPSLSKTVKEVTEDDVEVEGGANAVDEQYARIVGSGSKAHEDKKLNHLLKLGSAFLRDNSLRSTRTNSLRNTTNSSRSSHCSSLHPSRNVEKIIDPDDKPRFSLAGDRASVDTAATALTDYSYPTPSKQSVSNSPYSSDNKTVTLLLPALSDCDSEDGRKRLSDSILQKTINMNAIACTKCDSIEINSFVNVRDKGWFASRCNTISNSATKKIAWSSAKSRNVGNEVTAGLSAKVATTVNVSSIKQSSRSQNSALLSLPVEEMNSIQQGAIRQQMIREGNKAEDVDRVLEATTKATSSKSAKLSQNGSVKWSSKQLPSTKSQDMRNSGIDHLAVGQYRQSFEQRGTVGSFFRKLF